ncbi:hypothetical protein KP509_19G038200 [Ceratopteris richardii]|uniref:Uncharacterized protein n=1 Tax=Ceratopteris richardii TaxID=49495 RepID=A0A8T2SKC0_CERRI|nr:hypothetical protein KP509_19G038200 [Ceratopteris richardii]KAH7352280.1 hypothetical protein KP509_19G038200 [Ceratopteris richardii]KAH7352282.1 hypothetical protein KP509_19G038200 [Ceratopteris richardii]KAH7352283.1 hypothetical protein KP509_19G038200 [Ceratopteris richardii]KAH7352285.1 hypothetical protein KP509_19G038200 [Ceratopteris richardii]
MRSGRRPKEIEVSAGHGDEKSLRRPSSGISLDRKNTVASTSKAGLSSKSRPSVSTRSPGNSIKDFLKRLGDSEAFSLLLSDWLDDQFSGEGHRQLQAMPPFESEELRQFDFALEGVKFQQLLRMPTVFSSSSSALSIEAEMCLATEDFLHASAQGLWETFWSSDEPFPYFVTGSHGFGSKNAYGDKNASKKAKGPHCAALVGKNGGAYALWEHILEFVLLKPELSLETGKLPDTGAVGQAVFYALHMLLSRKMARSKSAVHKHSNTAYILLVNSHSGCVVKVEGDVTELDINTTKVYDSAVAWVQERAQIMVSTVEQVWNRLGNANWGDVGALQLLLATLYSMEQCKGSPKKSISDLASYHNFRLQRRRVERRILEVHENGIDASAHYQSKNHSREIEEIEEEIIDSDTVKGFERMKLDQGTILWLEDSHWQRGFKILDNSNEGRNSVYKGTALDDASKLLNVYVGAHPSQLEPSWEDMSTWYQVQRQTRILNVMKQRGISSKYLPQLVASGRILHPGSCSKQSPGGRCDHPWCGTPILVTSPVGEPMDVIVQKQGVLTSEEALKCCHDCLSALRSAGSAGIQHGDITPEHVLRVVGGDGESYHVLIGWGRAVLEDRDSPGISLRFSSTYALQEGKLCPSSDSESLVYLLYVLCGGSTPQFDSIESALQWRERSWARRAIQQQLGEISAVLKAFADYVDSLCGTPYPVDYDIWFRRLNRVLYGEDSGKRMQNPSLVSRRISDIAESSGT